MKKLFYLFLTLIPFITFSQTTDSLKLYTNEILSKKDTTFLFFDGWKFKTGDNVSWKNTTINDADWLTIKTDAEQKIVKQTIKFDKIGWFRNSFEVDSTLVNIPLSINISLYNGAYSIYLDGELLNTFGEFSTKEKESVTFLSINELNPTYTSFIFKKPGKHTFAIKYENTEVKTVDYFFNLRFKITKTENVIIQQNEKNNITAVFTIISAVFITLSVFHLILFLFYREFKPNLYFSLFSFSMGGLFIVISYFIMITSNTGEEIAGKFVIFLTALSAFALSGLVNTLFTKQKLRFKIFSIILLIVLLTLPFYITISEIAVPFLFLFACIESTILLIKAIVKKVKGARILASGILLTVFFIIVIAIIFIIFSNNGNLKLTSGQDETATILISIAFIGLTLSVFSIPFSMSAYLAWYFSYINEENENKLTEVKNLTEENLTKEKEKQLLIENINSELETQVENRKKEVEIQKTEIQLQNKTLEIERQKYEELLLNILPEEVATELKEKGKTQSKFFDNVTILFTDFKDFTKLSEKVSSTELIEELNYCFKEFDKIISKYGIEKIKTIGDAYMAVSGLPIKDEKHAIKMVYAALEIRDFIEEYKQKRMSEGKEYFEMRIGINSGEVVAGIVGIKKFAYDVWGTAVNIASEMEVNGSIGKVNISENTFKLVKNNFSTELRHEKLEGFQQNMYFAELKDKSVNFEKAKDFILNKLTEELPKHLYYHNIDHILDVYEAAILYAKLEGISTEDTELLKIAALFHDSGFIVKANGHELISCNFAEKYLPDFGYNAHQIEKIKGMIMATKIPQAPKNYLEQILADADLDYLGRTDFEEISNGLFEELKVENNSLDINSWNKIQVSFFEKHSYFTESAKRLRNNKKQENLQLIKSQIS